MTVVDDIKTQIDIVDYIETSGVKLRRTGKNYIGFCPFHVNTRTPAFVVFPESQSWRCFGQCNEGGDLFGFVMKKEGLDFAEALKKLADKAGIVLKPLTPEAETRNKTNASISQMLEDCVTYYRSQMLETPSGKKALEYVRKRGLTDETIKIWGIGYAPAGWEDTLSHLTRKGYTHEQLIAGGMVSERADGHIYDKFRNRLMFPIRDTYGKMLGFGGRILDPNDNPKYMNSPKTDLFDKGRILFGLDMARQSIRRNEQAVIVEGYMDVIGLHQAGFDNAVSGMGTALTEDQFKLLKKFSNNIILALDPDAAGEKATLKGLETARQSMDQETELSFDSRGLLHVEHRLNADVRVTTLPDGVDPDEIVLNDPEAWRRIIAEAQPVVIHVLHSLMAGKDMEDAKIKREIADAVLPLIADVPNPVERESYRQTLARELRIDERSLTLKPLSAPAKRRRQINNDDPLPSGKFNKANELSGSKLLEHSLILYFIEDPDRVYKVNKALAAANLDPLKIDDFNEADCKECFRIVDAAMAQDEISTQDYLAANLPDILEPIEEPEDLESNLVPTEEKRLKSVLRMVYRLRKKLVENRIQDLIYLQQNAEEKTYTDEELHVLVMEQISQRSLIDKALAADDPPKRQINYHIPTPAPKIRKR